MTDDAKNFLLRSLPPEDVALLDGRLEPVELGHRFVLERANRPVEHVYFPDSGVASIAATAPRGRRIEAGVFGREGMSGLSVLMGAGWSPNETFMQVAGSGRRIVPGDLLDAMDRSATLRLLLLRWAHCVVVQTSQTVLANGQAKLEERLARWLLMCHDRFDGDELPLTHEFLSLMLGVRRAGVTVALSALESRGLIRVHRGGNVLLDREGLKALADGCYGVPEAEYRRLFGQAPWASGGGAPR